MLLLTVDTAVDTSQAQLLQTDKDRAFQQLYGMNGSARALICAGRCAGMHLSALQSATAIGRGQRVNLWRFRLPAEQHAALVQFYDRLHGRTEDVSRRRG